MAAPEAARSLFCRAEHIQQPRAVRAAEKSEAETKGSREAQNHVVCLENFFDE